MPCSVSCAYLPLKFALLSTVTPLSSHCCLTTGVFKHWPMSCSWCWLDTASRVSFNAASLESPRQPGHRAAAAAERPKFCCWSNCCCCSRPTGLLLLLRSQFTKLTILFDIAPYPLWQFSYSSRSRCNALKQQNQHQCLKLARCPVYWCCCALSSSLWPWTLHRKERLLAYRRLHTLVYWHAVQASLLIWAWTHKSASLLGYNGSCLGRGI